MRCFVGLNQYDCLKGNRVTSLWGLEARLPFLFKEFINVAMAIDLNGRCSWKGGLRNGFFGKAFHDEEHPYRTELRVSSSKSFSSSCRRQVKNRAFHSGVTMGLMQSRGKGISASALPYKRTPPSWRTSASEEHC
ncbi:Asparagine synthetase [glutamine-hydrolyzing] 1 [Linum grandiflorum]